jgi:NitT/TauT family transport system ATP-binding protein
MEPAMSVSTGEPVPATVRVQSLRAGYRGLEVLRDVHLQARPGEVLAILGPSGCGKSTLLRVLAGFTPAMSGTVEVDGAPVTGPGPERGMVAQDATLFPWRSVRANLAWGPRAQGLRDPLTIADRLAAEVGLADFAHALPAALSGGMRQRAAIAQVLAARPRVLLLDEPFAALDAQTRLRMHGWMRSLLRSHPITTVLVTHDVEEALLLGDRVALLTPRPAAVAERIDVPLGEERDLSTVGEPGFAALKQRVLAQVLAGGNVQDR